ncbi:VCBS repeat-containing protein [Aquimarina algiphila]|nr:VCBS repeat-containing protein [Aquimarina algiphila]
MLRYIFILSIFIVSCSKSKTENTPAPSSTLFSLLDQSKTNITFNNNVTEDYYNFFGVFNYAYNGAGVAIGDINNDGLSDIYFVGNQVDDKLYLNKGNFVFEDITIKSGIKQKKAWHNGVVMADVNGDNLLDIYITVGGWNETKQNRKNLLYINQGNATFKEEAQSYGIADHGFSLMASFFDMDNDNDLDLYVTNRPNQFFLGIEAVVKGKKQIPNNYSDKLYKNDNGKFIDVSSTNGITNTLGYGLGIVTSDLDKDGHTDIYVGNDFFENDYYFKNKGVGVFNEQIDQFSNHISYFTMGVDAVDVNNDGFEDLFSLDMYPNDYVRAKTTMAPMDVQSYNKILKHGFYNQYMHNVLNLNNGNGFFSDVSQLAGVNSTDWSWACLGADFDNDGDNDIFVSNGYKRDLWDRDANNKRNEYTSKPVDRNKTPNQIIKEVVNLYPSVKLRNYIFENQGDLSFTNRATDWGLKDLSFSNGAAYGDLDNDGDLDLVVNNIDDEAFIYQNTTENLTKNNFLKVKLNGPKLNSNGLGAKITIFHQDSIQFKDFKTVRGYLSSVAPIVHFGLGQIKTIDSLSVVWTDGKQNILRDINVNQQIVIKYKNAIHTAIKEEKNKSQLLTDITNEIFKSPLHHIENEYDDYKNQILLPHKLSTLGPALAIGDINNDGLEDFFLGGSKGYSSQIYLQTKDSKFIIKEQPELVNDQEQEDVFASFFDVDNDNDLDLYVVSGGNEFESENKFYNDRLYLNNGSGNFTKSSSLPQINTSGSCLVPIDFDNDGDLDLFIGSRHTPRKYPKPSSSFILENRNGKFIDVTNTIAPELKDLGMVTSAISSNIDTDQDKELLIVGEWMKIHVFKWKNGKYNDITDDLGLAKTHGWWNRIEANDIDNDGDMDFVVGNLGLNYKFKASTEKPFYIFASDYDQNGTQDVFLAKKLDDKLVPIRGKQCSTEQLPGLEKKFQSYKEFANAGLFDIIGKDQESALKYQAEIFASIFLINDNGKFIIKELPTQAQFSVINGIIIDDFNQDGIKDMLLGGNRFEVEIETTRSDASIGLVLLGTKTGKFKAQSYHQSGLFIPYNVKNIKKIKLSNNKNGVLVASNNSHLKCYIVN